VSSNSSLTQWGKVSSIIARSCGVSFQWVLTLCFLCHLPFSEPHLSPQGVFTRNLYKLYLAPDSAKNNFKSQFESWNYLCPFSPPKQQPSEYCCTKHSHDFACISLLKCTVLCLVAWMCAQLCQNIKAEPVGFYWYFVQFFYNSYVFNQFALSSNHFILAARDFAFVPKVVFLLFKANK